MSKPVVVTARISQELSADLDRLAELRDRSRAWLIEKAVAEFVREDLEFRLSLEEADAQIERGEFVTHEELFAGLRARFGRRDAA